MNSSICGGCFKRKVCYTWAMRLSELLQYDNIIIQCHNTPDADALASGFALLQYFQHYHKNATMIYGGIYAVSKPSLVQMMKELNIIVHHVRTQEEINPLLHLLPGQLPDLLITVDCRYGEGNVDSFEAENVAVIDHHPACDDLPFMAYINDKLASCATVVWQLLKAEDFEVNDNRAVATALYYGLMTDSSNFVEVNHPLDNQMRDELEFDNNLITQLKHSNISQEELRIAGIALLGAEYHRWNKYTIVKTDPCDSNVLGVIADMVLEVDDVDCCLVYSNTPDGVKLSVRSCIKEVKANELAAFICQGVGDGGGHLIKAGGFANKQLIGIDDPHYENVTIHEFFRKRMHDYFAQRMN